MRLLAGKRRRKGHAKERQGWRFFGVSFAFPERSAPQFCLPLTRSRRAVSEAVTF